jgi:hypothetical protein
MKADRERPAASLLQTPFPQMRPCKARLRRPTPRVFVLLDDVFVLLDDNVSSSCSPQNGHPSDGRKAYAGWKSLLVPAVGIVATILWSALLGMNVFSIWRAAA